MRTMITRHALAAALLALLAGCAGVKAKREHQQDMLLLLQRLPGHYDNVAQVDAAGAGAAGSALDLRIIPVEASVVGEHVYYVRVAVAGDARRVLSQQIWSFSQDQNGNPVQAVYLFADPGRWRGAADTPQLLEALTDADLKSLRGCSLDWHKQDSGYEGTTGKSCRESGEEAEGLLIDQRIVLADAGLTVTQWQFGGDGRLDSGSEVDHFRRRPQPTSTLEP